MVRRFGGDALQTVITSGKLLFTQEPSLRLAVPNAGKSAEVEDNKLIIASGPGGYPSTVSKLDYSRLKQG